jgi:hypothetical protein
MKVWSSSLVPRSSGDAALAHDLAGVEPVLDALGVDVSPAVHHVVHCGVPRALVREAQAGRVHAVAHGKGGLHHRSILPGACGARLRRRVAGSVPGAGSFRRLRTFPSEPATDEKKVLDK